MYTLIVESDFYSDPSIDVLAELTGEHPTITRDRLARLILFGRVPAECKTLSFERILLLLGVPGKTEYLESMEKCDLLINVEDGRCEVSVPGIICLRDLF